MNTGEKTKITHGSQMTIGFKIVKDEVVTKTEADLEKLSETDKSAWEYKTTGLSRLFNTSSFLIKQLLTANSN